MVHTSIQSGLPGGGALHEKELTRNSVRIALHHHCTLAKVRDKNVGHVRVILQEISFGEFLFRPEDLVQVREPYFTAAHRDVALLARPGDLDGHHA